MEKKLKQKGILYDSEPFGMEKAAVRLTTFIAHRFYDIKNNYNMNPDIDNCLIKKHIVHPGTSYKPLINGCKVHFHFQTRKADESKTLIDDSRVIGKKEPMMLVLGKKFKLEVWEVIVMKMAINEVATFIVDKSLVLQYPFVSKTLRELNKHPSEKRGHVCAVTLQNEGIGFNDLNEFILKPCDLEFTIELLKVEFPEDYKKDSWQLTDEEKIVLIPELKESGNNLYREKKYEEAASSYAEAIAYCEHLMNKEKPHDTDWDKLNDIKLPILLNYAQCLLCTENYYGAIQHCTSVLEFQPDNVKAIYRRAKSYKGAWSLTEATHDFKMAMERDPSLTASCLKELKEIEALQKTQDQEDKIKLKNMFT